MSVPVQQTVPEGYKQTEVGVIPDEWDVIPLAELSKDGGLVRGPFGGALKKEIFVKSGYVVYEQRHAISGSFDVTRYFIDSAKYNELTRFKVKVGDFIVSCSGTIGRIYKIPTQAPEGIINQALLKITLRDNVNADYFLLLFRSSYIQEKIVDSSHGGAMPNLVGMDDFKKTSFQFPCLKEQTAIADALSDVDGLIGSLEKLIAKKRAIKTAAMQQLLTGKKRLPPFDQTHTGYKQTELGEIPNDWEACSLGDIAKFYKGRGLPKSDLVAGGVRQCIHYGELFTQYGEIIDRVISRTNVSYDVFLSEVNDVLMPTSDVTPNGLATASGIKQDGVVLGGDVLVIRANKAVLDSYFFAYLVSISKERIMKLVSGSTVYHLYGSDMATFKFALPTDVHEQIAMADALTDMGKEISSLEQRLNKTQQLKQGMMQELLTGRTRLV